MYLLCCGPVRKALIQMDDLVREFVRRRAEFRCEYCCIPESVFVLTFQIEHIVAKSHGGTDDESNLALACRRCNLHKGPNLSGMPSEGVDPVRLFNPRRDEWSDHFSMSPDGRLVGGTDIGDVTIRVLQMNHPRRVALRAAIQSLDRD